MKQTANIITKGEELKLQKQYESIERLIEAANREEDDHMADQLRAYLRGMEFVMETIGIEYHKTFNPLA